MNTQNTTPAIENEFVSFGDMFQNYKFELSFLKDSELAFFHRHNKTRLVRLKEAQQQTTGRSFSEVKPFIFRVEESRKIEREILQTVVKLAKQKIKDQADFTEGMKPEDHPNYYFLLSERLIEAIETFQSLVEKRIVNRFTSQN